jgi:MFS family permease
MEQMTKTQKSVLLVSTLTSFLGPFIISSVNIALPDIEQYFAIDAITLSWIITSFLLSSAIFLLPMGKWADIIGTKRVFKYGTIVFVVFTFLCAITNSASILIVARFLQGIGAAMLMTTGPAILVSEFPIRQRGRVLGINVAAVYIGLSVGPVVGGFVTLLHRLARYLLALRHTWTSRNVGGLSVFG